MRNIYPIVLAVLSTLGLSAQVAPVPTSWDMESGLPSGWTTNQTSGNEFYTSVTCNNILPNGRSFKLDNSGRFLQVELAGSPGPVSFEIGGQTGSAPYFNGTFLIQESVTGQTWQTIKTYTGAQCIPSNNDAIVCLQDTAYPTNTAVRFIRFLFQTKFSGNAATGGGNVKLDNIGIALPAFTQPKIKVDNAGTTLFNGGVTAPVSLNIGQSGPVNLSVINQAVSGGPLVIDSIRISGNASGDYTLSGPTFPISLNPLQSQSLSLSFQPSVSGTREATMTLYSGDFTADSVFLVTLYGVGGALASAPSFAPQSITTVLNKSYRQVLQMLLPSSGPDAYGGYLVLRSEGSAPSMAPVNGASYARGASIGNAKVIYVGNPGAGSLSLRPNWVRAGINYHFAIYSYNGTGTLTHYSSTAVPTLVNSPATMLSSTYYAGVDPQNATFVSDLHSAIGNHTAIFYSSYIQTMIMGFDVRDTFVTSGAFVRDRVLDCGYSRLPILFVEPFVFGALGTSREHTFPHSWYPTFPANSPERHEYSDQHNLYPVFQNVNEMRCNYPFGKVENVINTNAEGKLGLNVLGQRVFEPGSPTHKGKIARSMMYMATRYNTVNGNAWNFNSPIGNNCNGILISYAQDPSVILNWHFDYPPDAYDIARNDFLDSLQGNRNPFVDNPNWPCYINFTNMTWISNPTLPCATLGDSPQTEMLPMQVWPNPAGSEVNVSFWNPYEGQVRTRLFDIAGRSVLDKVWNAIDGEQHLVLSLEGLPTGLYQLRVESPSGNSTRKLMVGSGQ